MKDKLKIAVVAPLYLTIPPSGYGGIERNVHYLAQEFVRLGHNVTVYCAGDSQTAGTIRASIPKALGLDPPFYIPVRDHAGQMLDIIKEQDQFDIINFHCNHIQYLIESALRVPYVTTLELSPMADSFHPAYCTKHPFIAISEAQKAQAPHFNWVGTALNGEPIDLYAPRYEPGKYLAFLGSFIPPKGADVAIEIAKKAGLPLRMGAIYYDTYKDYFESKIKPEIGKNGIEYLGELGEEGKQDLLSNAKAMLFPIAWDEPFGLVMIESMACATPVIATPRGAVAEVVKHGETGFIAKDVNEAVEAVKKVDSLDRRAVRKDFEDRFTSRRMAESHLEIFRKLIAAKCAA